MPFLEQHHRIDGWTYAIYSPDTPADEFGDLGVMKARWDSKRQGDRLPAWRDFDLMDLDGFHGWVVVEDIIEGPLYDSVYRLWGTKLADLFDVELTNRRFSDMIGIISSEEEREFWTEYRNTNNVVLVWGTMDWLERYDNLYGKMLREITLPLADDGVTVDRYMTVVSLP